MELNKENFIRDGKEKINFMGKSLNVYFRLYKKEEQDPEYLQYKKLFYIVFVPGKTKDFAYINDTEEKAMEDFLQCYEKDLLTVMTTNKVRQIQLANLKKKD